LHKKGVLTKIRTPKYDFDFSWQMQKGQLKIATVDLPRYNTPISGRSKKRRGEQV
jgi:hypothetical protein